jgi:hypothetical protein
VGTGGRAGSSTAALGTGGKTGSTAAPDSAVEKSDTPAAAADQAGSSGDTPLFGGTCTDFTPCGGSILGTWYLRSECDTRSVAWICAGSTILLEVPSSTIQYTFRADGTLSVSSSGLVNMAQPMPLSCLNSDAGPAQACSDLEQGLRQGLGGYQDAGSSSGVPMGFTCSLASAQSCTCVTQYSLLPTETTGAYTLSGNRILTENPSFLSTGVDGGTAGTVDYCVSGDTLNLGWDALQPNASNHYVATLTR